MVNNRATESVWTAFERTAAIHGTRDFLHVPTSACRGYAARPITISYRDANERAVDLASQLQAAGYGPGHRVCLGLDNRPDFYLYFLAFVRLGVSIVPLNVGMSTPELSYVLNHADIALVITHKDHAPALQSALPDSTPLHILTDRGVPPPAKRCFASVNEAALLYTSGTTGTPKGCILSQEYFLEIGRLYTNLGGTARSTGPATGWRLRFR